MLRLMCVTAHPDDEAGSFGGTLRKYSDEGVETCVVCLTPGQAATHRGGAKSDQELAETRRREFAASCEILGVTRPVILNYPDGQLYRQELNRVVYELTALVREFCPHVLITLGAEGGVTGHPDHSMAGIFATLAFHWAGRSNRYADQLKNGFTPHITQKLYYQSAEAPLPNRFPITLPPITAVIEIGEQLQAKIAAFEAHKTQEPLWTIFRESLGRRGTVEMFHLAAGVGRNELLEETDLFAGVTDVEVRHPTKIA